MKPLSLLVGIVLLLIEPATPLSTARADDFFSFGGFTFDQRNTPDQAARLGNSMNLGGAVFSAGYASEVTLNSVNFPQSGTGFNTNLSLAQLVGLKNGLYAVNLPNGNNGTTNRHGLEVWWSNNRSIENLAGPDFVIYESASAIGSPEGVMVRVRTNRVSDGWTDWFYFASTNFQTTTGAQGLNSYAFDASIMGAANGAIIDRIQLANLMQADRIAATGTNVGGNLIGQGKVIFDSSTTVQPDAGNYDSNRIFDTDQFDPDPLYVASLQTAFETAPQVIVSRTGASMTITWPAPTAYGLQTTSEIGGTNWISSSTAIVVTNGFNVATVTATNAVRFFRLIKP
jgi:hypothetical protein